MDKTTFYQEIESLLELPQGTLEADPVLNHLLEWDSVAVIGFIALADSTYGVILPPDSIDKCRTVDDLANLIEERQAAKPAQTKTDGRA